MTNNQSLLLGKIAKMQMVGMVSVAKIKLELLGFLFALKKRSGVMGICFLQVEFWSFIGIQKDQNVQKKMNKMAKKEVFLVFHLASMLWLKHPHFSRNFGRYRDNPKMQSNQNM